MCSSHDGVLWCIQRSIFPLTFVVMFTRLLSHLCQEDTFSNHHLSSQAPSVGSAEASLPGVVEQMQPQFISRFLEGQSGVTIKSVSCGDLFTTCMTGWWTILLWISNREITLMPRQPGRELCYRKSMFILCFLHLMDIKH